MRTMKHAMLLVCICLIALTSCAGNVPQSGASKAVDTYIRALVERDENRAIAASCADWEAQAKVEYNSFSAVRLDMEGLSCQESGKDDQYVHVRCSGSIVANYGAEDLTIDIAARTYRAIEEGGEWRMCGYAKQ